MNYIATNYFNQSLVISSQFSVCCKMISASVLTIFHHCFIAHHLIDWLIFQLFSQIHSRPHTESRLPICCTPPHLAVTSSDQFSATCCMVHPRLTRRPWLLRSKSDWLIKWPNNWTNLIHTTKICIFVTCSFSWLFRIYRTFILLQYAAQNCWVHMHVQWNTCTL